MKQRRWLSLLLAVVMVFCLLPETAFAAVNVAYVKWANGSSTTEYTTFKAAWDAAVSTGDNNTVGLYSDCKVGLTYVPAGKTVTLELNGHSVSRDRSSSDENGEVFLLYGKTTLNIYGGNKANPAEGATNTHNMNVYVPYEYGYKRQSLTLQGGVIHGGNSCNDYGGGAIQMLYNDAKLNLYNVTIAGNMADRSGSCAGLGGGISMAAERGYLYMENSRICYNYASYDGGGLYVGGNYCTVEMVNSRIDHNTSDDRGAGVFVNGKGFTLTGDAKQMLNPKTESEGVKGPNGAISNLTYFTPDSLGSSISYNFIWDSDGGGGGFYLNQEKALIEGVNVIGNVATNRSGDGDGGGFYLNDEKIVIRNCNILWNKADELGGGIYVNDGEYDTDKTYNTVDSSTVWKNVAMETGGAGGGIYVGRKYDLCVSGKLIVRDNESASFNYTGVNNDDIYLSAMGAYEAYLIPALTTGADVHVRTGEHGHSGQISVNPGTYDDKLFSYNNDIDKHIEWISSRHLWVADGEKPVPPTRVFDTDYDLSGERTQEVDSGYTALDGNNYKLIRGIVSYPSFPDDNADIETLFYYSDGFFAGSPSTYNEHLATASLCLAGAAGYSNEYGKDDHEGGMTSDYLDKSQNFRQFVSDIGCADADIYVNDFNTQKPGADTIGVGIASKNITIGSTQKKLVIIGVRGMGYEKEWISNMTLGASGEAAGWSSAATQVMAELKGYLSRKGIDGTSSDTIFWIAGYSRAGATSNLTAKRIVDTYDPQGTHTFAYPLEAPKGGQKSELVAGNNYNCIHNVVNQNDIVPWTGTTEMGFIRYGVDHYIPGSNATDTRADNDGNNIPEDNKAWNVGSTDYNKQKAKMLAQLAAVNPDIVFDDYFAVATINYLANGVYLYDDLINECDAGSKIYGYSTEQFIKLFFEKLQEYAFKYDTNGNVVSGYTPRTYFSTYKVKNGRTFQQAAGATAGLVFGKDAASTSGLIDCFAGLMDRLGMLDKLSLWDHIDASEINDLVGEIDGIWDMLVNPGDDKLKGYRPITDFLTAAEKQELEANIVPLLFPLLCFLAEDYSNYSQDIVGTLGYNISRIIANHYPEVTHAWLRSFDDFYSGDTVHTIMADAAKTDPSPVALQIKNVNSYSDPTTVTPKNGETIEIHIDDEVRLVPSDGWKTDKGEAFYYQFTSGQDHTAHAFSEPFRFSEMVKENATNGVFTIKVIAAHNGVKLDPVTFSIKFWNASVISVPEAWDNESLDYTYKVEPFGIREEYELSWINPNIEGQEFRFKRWEVYAYTDETQSVGDRITEDHYIEYFGWDFKPADETTVIENSCGVSAKFVPVYDWIITRMPIDFTGGTELPSHVTWQDDPVSGAQYPIYWRYDETEKNYIGEFSIDIPANRSLAEKSDLVVKYGALENYQVTECRTIDVSFADQRAHFEVAFVPVDGDSGEAINSLATLQTMDLNLNEVIETLYFDLTGLDTVIAPDQLNMEFVKWDNDSTSRSIEVSAFANDTVVTAYYRPVVNEIDVTLKTAPTSGVALPEMDSTTVTITNTWKIDNAEMTWRTTDTVANYDTVYTARITVKKETLTGTNLSVSGVENYPLTGAFSLAENVAVNVKDANGTPITLTNYVFSETDTDIILDLVFTTGKMKIVRFADTGITISYRDMAWYGYDYGHPDEVDAYLEDGRMISVPVKWGKSQESILNDDSITQVIHWEGKYTGDVYDVAEGIMPILTETLLRIERPNAPQATPGSGDYTGVLTISLTADENSEIYYRVVDYIGTNDNELHGPWFYLSTEPDQYTLKYEEPIVLSEYRDNDYYLFAYAKDLTSGNLSNAVTYRYGLTKPEVIKLEAKAPMIAEDGNNECWYSTVTKQIGDDDNGEPIYEQIPDQYYGDKDCTVLLNYSNDVRVPAFIYTSHETNESDDVAVCLERDTYRGFETLGVQAIGEDGEAARVLTVLDARIIEAAKDYGYLFDTDETKLTAGFAQFAYSCKDTTNTLYGGEDYCYVTAELKNSFLDPNMKACFYVKLENDTDYIYTDAVVCEATIDRSDVTDEAEDNIAVNDAVPVFKSHALLLSGEIGVNFYLDLSMLTNDEREESWMEFTVCGKTANDSFDADCTNPSTHKYYGFTCYINSVQMADEITAVLHYTKGGESKTVSQTYSAKDYVDYVLTHTDGYSSNTVALVKAIADYGHYVQPFLATTRGWKLGTDHAVMTGQNTLTASDVEAAKTAVADRVIVRDVGDSQIEKVTYSLNLETETAIRIYLKVKDGYTGNVTATMNGSGIDCVKQSDGRYQIEISGISAHKLGETYEVKVSAGGEFTISVSALSYVNTVLNSESSVFNNDDARYAVTALYNYYVAAMNYLSNPNN
ncbi:MAG: hypothetical protein J5649_06880 [Lachnospiraceae bacterium]|nr:hypothetical protein [Lachnospiraceae bacterium]